MDYYVVYEFVTVGLHKKATLTNFTCDSDEDAVKSVLEAKSSTLKPTKLFNLTTNNDISIKSM